MVTGIIEVLCLYWTFAILTLVFTLSKKNRSLMGLLDAKKKKQLRSKSVYRSFTNLCRQGDNNIKTWMNLYEPFNMVCIMKVLTNYPCTTKQYIVHYIEVGSPSTVNN